MGGPALPDDVLPTATERSVSGQLIPFNGKSPRVHPSAFIAPTAVLIGDVEVGEEASVWFGAVLRADHPEHGIRIGDGLAEVAGDLGKVVVVVEVLGVVGQLGQPGEDRAVRPGGEVGDGGVGELAGGDRRPVLEHDGDDGVEDLDLSVLERHASRWCHEPRCY